MRKYHKIHLQLQELDFKDKFEQIGLDLLEVGPEHQPQVVSRVKLEATIEIHYPHLASAL